MFLFMMNDTTTKTAANTMRLMTEAMEAWSAVAAHNASLAPSVLRTMNSNAPLTPPDAGFDANWAAEAATLYVRAHRSSWRAALEGWKSMNAMKDVELTTTPFGLTGVFASTAPDTASHTPPKPRSAKPKADARPSAPATPATSTTAAATPTKAPTTAAARKAAAPKKAADPQPAAQKPAPQKPAKKAQAAALDIVLAAPRGDADDLTRIKGIGPKLCGALHDLGIFHFWQIAQLAERDIAWINDRLRFKGRIERERWVEQAKALAGDTASA